MFNDCDLSFGAPLSEETLMTLMDLIESDELGDLDVEFLNNEARHIKSKDFGKGYKMHGQFFKNDQTYKLEVYTICQKFQYSTCTISKCKYVHSSTNELQVGAPPSQGPQHPNDQMTSPNAMASSSLAQLPRNPFPKRNLPEAAPLPAAIPEPAPIMNVADIPLPDSPPLQTSRMVQTSPLPRAPKRRWLAMEAADNCSGRVIKRCAKCHLLFEL